MMLPQLLKRWRETENLTLAQLAHRIGIERTALWKFERGDILGNKNFTRIFLWLLREEQPIAIRRNTAKHKTNKRSKTNNAKIRNQKR